MTSPDDHTTGPDGHVPSAAPDDFNLHERVFEMVSSTSSRVDPVHPTRFVYYESDGMLWGDYTGDTVELGKFCGARTHDLIELTFVHRDRAGDVVRGGASSRIERDDDGLLRLTEDFTGADGASHVSVCRELPTVVAPAS
ncbi:hypothetical protein [Phytoactinopolyspora endophytica]|uniref:hypothetical protein n=1 Tax=Phytoactinopolyspora endophytica TaxID=1642495 RepID=UPI00197C91AD|nr:hypothetical protein [Phytoactinopolyspora endophytica]